MQMQDLAAEAIIGSLPIEAILDDAEKHGMNRTHRRLIIKIISDIREGERARVIEQETEQFIKADETLERITASIRVAARAASSEA